jgi:hypothetical protein
MFRRWLHQRKQTAQDVYKGNLLYKLLTLTKMIFLLDLNKRKNDFSLDGVKVEMIWLVNEVLDV